MNNYDKALKLENSALNSNGKAMQKYAVYQDGIAAKQDRINALAQTWVQNMDFEWVIGSLLDLAESFMKVFSNENAAMVAKFTVAIIAFSKAYKALLPAINLFKEMKGLVSTGELVMQVFGAAGIGTVIPVLAAVAVAITAIVWAVQKFHKSTEELRQELQGLDGELETSKGSVESYKDEIESNNDKIRELQELINKGTGGLVEQEEVDKLKEQNSELEYQIKLEERRQELIEAQRKENVRQQYAGGFEVQHYTGALSMSGEVIKGQKETVSPEDVVASYQSDIDYLTQRYHESVEMGLVDAAETFKAKAAEVELELMDTVIPALQEMASIVDEQGNFLYPELNAQIQEYIDSTKTYSEKVKDISDNYQDAYNEFGQIVADNMEVFQQYLDSGGEDLDTFIDTVAGGVTPAIRAMIQAAQKAGIPFMELVRILLNAAKAGEDFSDSVQLETPAQQVEMFKDKVSAVIAAEEELTDTGYVSADAAAKLAEVYGTDVYNAMTWTEKGYIVSKDALEDLLEKEKEEYVLALTKAKNAANAIVNANIAESASYRTKTADILAAVKAKKQDMLTEHYSGRGARGLPEGWAELSEVEKDLETAQANLDNLEKTIAYLRSLGGGGGSKTTSSTSTKDKETEYERNIRLLEHQLYLSEQVSDTYKDNDEEVAYRKEINKQLEIYTKLMATAHEEAERLRKLGYKEESEEIQDLQKAWWGYYNEKRDLQSGLADWEKQLADDTASKVEDALSEVKDAINDLLDEAEDALNKKLDDLEAKIKKNEAMRDLASSYFDVLNGIADQIHQLDSDLAASKRSADYLDESLRDTMFNESDYAKLRDKLDDIADSSTRLYKQYLDELEMLTEDDIYKADIITEEFQRQYEYKKLEYEVASKELDLVKAQTKLQNTLMNRNVRMYKNGKWIWTADYSAVEEARRELEDAQYEYKNAQIKLKQQDVINHYNDIIADLEMQKGAAQAQFDALKAKWEEVQKQLTTEEDAMTRLLKAINETDIPEFKNIISSVGSELNNLIDGINDFTNSLLDIDMQEKLNQRFDENDLNVERWESKSGTTHSSGYGIEDTFAVAGGGTAVSTGGRLYGVYDKNQNVIGWVDKDTGLVEWNGDSNITGWKDTMNSVLKELGVKQSGTAASGTISRENYPSSGGSSSGGSYTGTSSSGGTYTIGSEKGKNFVSNAKPGSTMPGDDGSTWTKNKDGSTTITKGDKKYTVHDSGGILRGMGSIKATTDDETVFDPRITSKILSPQKSRDFLNSANALTKMLDNSAAINSMLTRFSGLVTDKTSSVSDSHDINVNGSLFSRMTPSDSDAMASILRRYIPISRGWK